MSLVRTVAQENPQLGTVRRSRSSVIIGAPMEERQMGWGEGASKIYAPGNLPAPDRPSRRVYKECRERRLNTRVGGAAQFGVGSGK